MIFKTPGGVALEIPDDWWDFAGMSAFTPPSEYYPPSQCNDYEIVSLLDIEPLRSNEGTPLFRNTNWFLSCSPIELHPNKTAQYQYRIGNGCHGYYAPVAAGYLEIPTIIFEPLDA